MARALDHIGWLLVLTSLAVPEIAAANVGAFFGEGAQVVPMNSAEIRLVRERVIIRPRVDEHPGRFGAPLLLRADVEAEFRLENGARHPVALQVGFPLIGETYLPMLQLHARVGESERHVTLKRARADEKSGANSSPPFEHVFTWEESFGALESKTLTVTYRMLMGIMPGNLVKRGMDVVVRGGRVEEAATGGPDDVRYTHLDLLLRGAAFTFGYVTRTARSWTGPVERAEFVLDCAELERDLEKFDFAAAPPSLFFPGVGRPVILAQLSPEVARRDASGFRWSFVGAIPEEGLFALITLLSLPDSPERMQSRLAEQERWRGAGRVVTPEEFRAVVNGYYARILRADPGVESSFVRRYFDPVELTSAPLLFEKDRDRIRAAWRSAVGAAR